MRDVRALVECVETKDMHVGMETFLNRGARAKAPFINESSSLGDATLFGPLAR